MGNMTKESGPLNLISYDGKLLTIAPKAKERKTCEQDYRNTSHSHPPPSTDSELRRTGIALSSAP